MTPQSPFMVVAPIVEERVNGLKALLSSMNQRPGMARPDNSIVPFGEFENLHYARFVIVDDTTLSDFLIAPPVAPRFDAARRLRCSPRDVSAIA